MRYKFYKRMLGQMRYKKLIALILFFIVIFTGLAFVIHRDIIPTIKSICESRAQAIALTISSETIENHMNELEYENLMRLNYNSEGKLSTISANITQMNKLSAQIINEIQEKLILVESTTVDIPIGKLLGWSIFSGYGPQISIKLIPVGNVVANFKTEFTAEGINQTKHTVFIEIVTAVTIVAPFTSETITSTSVVSVAEMVIIGEIPNTYLNLNDITDNNKSVIK